MRVPLCGGQVEVDHSQTKGPRYTISYEHARVVRPLVEASRVQLCAYLREQAPSANVSDLFSPCGLPRTEPLLPRPTFALPRPTLASDATRDASWDAARSASTLASGTGVGAASSESERMSRHSRLLAEVAKLKARDEAVAKARDQVPAAFSSS